MAFDEKSFDEMAFGFDEIVLSIQIWLPEIFPIIIIFQLDIFYSYSL
jgi:hypothetical protein